MAARRRRTWIAIGGATAAVAIGALAAVALGAPTGLTAPSFTNAAPVISWSDTEAASSYDVARANGTCGSNPSFDPPALNVPNPFTDLPRPAQGIYCYRVTGHGYATTGDVNGDASQTTQVMVDTTPPVVQIISPATGFVGGTVSIQANASDADSGLAPGGFVVSVDNLILPTAPPLTWNTHVIGVEGGTYIVRAHAVDRAGNPSADSTVQVVIDNTGPGAPAVTFLQNPVTGSPTLVWAAQSGETYTVARTSSTGPGPKAFGSVTPNWTDPDTLTPGTYTYVVTAFDSAGNPTASAPASVSVISPSLTAPRSISANSPTNSVPHVVWQPPVSFLVGGWNIYRDGSLLTTISDPAASSYDDTGLAAQGPHTYAVQAVNGNGSGDLSSPVSVTYDTMAPSLPPASATANPDGSVSLGWPAAVDATPGSGLARYVVQRLAGPSAPTDPSTGTTVCSLPPSATGCIDKETKNNTSYSYGIFAIDGAGNFGWRGASARAVDTQAPPAVTGLRVVSFDRTYARLGWAVPVLKDANADLAGYRVLALRTVGKPPLNPNDGTVVCRNDDPKDTICDAINLVAGKKVSFAVYAYDGVPNYSTPQIVTMTPHSLDNKPPHKPTKVRLTHSGLTYTLKWVSPRDKDLSKFRVTLYDKGPGPRPSKGKAVVTGRVLHATFTLRAGQVVYVNLFAIDVSGNFSRVTRLIVAPGKIVPKSKHKVVKKKVKSTKKKAGKAKATLPARSG
jgi:fibronectin type 3 domain-containing protein